MIFQAETAIKKCTTNTRQTYHYIEKNKSDILKIDKTPHQSINEIIDYSNHDYFND